MFWKAIRDYLAGPNPLAIGELVQVKINDVWVLPAPEPVREIHDINGETWVLIGESNCGIPLYQVVRFA